MVIYLGSSACGDELQCGLWEHFQGGSWFRLAVYRGTPGSRSITLLAPPSGNKITFELIAR